MSIEASEQINSISAASKTKRSRARLRPSRKRFSFSNFNARQKRRQRVAVRVTHVEIPTYLPAKPDKNPMFLEKRVYQGSSGKVYPLPFTDRIAERPVSRKW